jgi:hypothetical protein
MSSPTPLTSSKTSRPVLTDDEAADQLRSLITSRKELLNNLPSKAYMVSEKVAINASLRRDIAALEHAILKLAARH